METRKIAWCISHACCRIFKTNYLEVPILNIPKTTVFCPYCGYALRWDNANVIEDENNYYIKANTTDQGLFFEVSKTPNRKKRGRVLKMSESDIIFK